MLRWRLTPPAVVVLGRVRGTDLDMADSGRVRSDQRNRDAPVLGLGLLTPRDDVTTCEADLVERIAFDLHEEVRARLEFFARYHSTPVSTAFVAMSAEARTAPSELPTAA